MRLIPEWQEANEVKMNRKSRQAAGKFIHKLGVWQIFITLTFRLDISEEKAHRLFRAYLRNVAQRFGEHLDIVWSWGPQQDGRIHFHALLKTMTGSTKVLKQRDFWGIPWPGNIKFDPPYDQKKSSCYIARRQHLHWEQNVVCPKWPPCKRRKRFCIKAQFPWPKPVELVGM